jgi:tripartite-type tricarboxylate transporter receptor subunit TctC
MAVGLLYERTLSPSSKPWKIATLAPLQRVLATIGSKRIATMRDVPTFEGLGLSVNPGNFPFLACPAAVPRPIENRLVALMEKVVQMPDVAARMADNGFNPAFIGPPASREYALPNAQMTQGNPEKGLKVN